MALALWPRSPAPAVVGAPPRWRRLRRRGLARLRRPGELQRAALRLALGSALVAAGWLAASGPGWRIAEPWWRVLSTRGPATLEPPLTWAAREQRTASWSASPAPAVPAGARDLAPAGATMGHGGEGTPPAAADALVNVPSLPAPGVSATEPSPAPGVSATEPSPAPGVSATEPSPAPGVSATEPRQDQVAEAPASTPSAAVATPAVVVAPPRPASSAGVPAAAPPRPTPTATAAPAAGTHIVARGETLSSIAARYGTSVSALARLNHLDDPDKITEGDRLAIPR
jgi:LysM repeat protein